jgi:hypothetical protein
LTGADVEIILFSMRGTRETQFSRSGCNQAYSTFFAINPPDLEGAYGIYVIFSLFKDETSHSRWRWWVLFQYGVALDEVAPRAGLRAGRLPVCDIPTPRRHLGPAGVRRMAR